MEFSRRINTAPWYDAQPHPALMVNNCAFQYQVGVGVGVPSPSSAYVTQHFAAAAAAAAAAAGNQLPAAMYGMPNVYSAVPFVDMLPIAQPAPVLPSPNDEPTEFSTDMTLSLHMEKVWHGVFTHLFYRFYPHNWHLLPTQNPVDEPGWKVFQDSAKVRFICSDCGRAWTSMKGRCIFWFKLDVQSRVGIVLFKLYGQRCQHCNHPDRFDHAMWYPHEVAKVVSNIYQKVGETYYRYPHQQIRTDRRPGKPRQRHNKDLCQACRDGICKDNDDSLKELRTVSPQSSEHEQESSGNSSVNV